MKILIFEDNTKQGRFIAPSIEVKARVYDLQTEKAKDLAEALSYLSNADIGLVIVHHSDFFHVDEMRRKFSDVKYAGFNGDLIVAREFGAASGTIGEKFIRKFSEHYDHILYTLGNDLEDVLRNLK